MRFLLVLLLLTAPAIGQDAGLLAAQAYQGRALILRGFPAANQLDYDPTGHLKKAGKVVDWTLSGMNLEKVTRRPDGALELEGPRVAILYKPDQHQFERHALKQTNIKVLLPAIDRLTTDRQATDRPATDRQATDKALAAIFSVGVDSALQRSMPPYWAHYFVPSLPWSDPLPDKDIIRANTKLPASRTYPVAAKKAEPVYTDEARTDKVKGTSVLLIMVDANGVPLRITIRQPLGYGLDAHAAEAIAKWHFQPGTIDGVPVAMEVVADQGFELVAAP